MGAKLKNLANNLTENQLAVTVKDSAQQIWLAGLGAFAKAQEEGGKMFDALVREGETVQARTRKMTDAKIAVVTSKATGTWDRLEQVFEDRVARALGSLGVPSKKDIDRLTKRVVDLSAAVEQLKKARPPAKTVVKQPAAKPTATKAPSPSKASAESKRSATAKPTKSKAAVKRSATKATAPTVTPADVLSSIARSAS